MTCIRKLELEDLDQIILLRTKIQNFDLKDIDSDKVVLNEEELITETKKYIENNLNKSLFLFGFFIDEELVANCGFYVDKHFPTFSNPSGIIAYICNVFTKEEYRNKGYQKQVFDMCFKYAKNMEITNFKLSSLNENAIKMYKSFGFKNSKSTYSFKV